MSLAYMGVPDRCEHGEYQDRKCPLCELERLRDAVAYLRENVRPPIPTSPAWCWPEVWAEFQRRVSGE